jgi:hypothetical protein
MVSCDFVVFFFRQHTGRAVAEATAMATAMMIENFIFRMKERPLNLGNDVEVKKVIRRCDLWDERRKRSVSAEYQALH